MISLLSPADQRELRAARTNTLLLRYGIVSLILVGLIVVEMAVVYFFFTNSQRQSQQLITENEQKVKEYAPIQAKATTFRSDLSTAKDILSKQVQFTTILRKLSNALPSGTSLSTIQLDPVSFGTPTTLVVSVKDYETAIKFKNDFQNSEVFSDISFESLTNASKDATYPLTATYNVTYNKNLLKTEPSK